MKMHNLSCAYIFRHIVHFVFALSIYLVPAVASSQDLNYDIAVAKLKLLAFAKEPLLLFNSRNDRLNLHGSKQKCVIIHIHGLYQSPKDQQGLAQHFFNLGCNVISPLLHGHWQKNPRAFHQITTQTWVDQIQNIVDLAHNLGDSVILSGHSTGGLLAFLMAINNPEKINSLVLFAPALKLTDSKLMLTQLGSFFDVSRTGKTNIDTEYDQYQKPARAGYLVYKLILKIFGQSDEKRQKIYTDFKIRSIIFSTENDDVISHKEILELGLINPQNVQVVSFSKSSGVFHDNIQRGPIDVVSEAPQSWINPEYEKVLNFTSDFFQPIFNSRK